MRNYVSSGDTVNLTAIDPVNSGQFMVMGELFGVATNTAASGELFGLKTEGVYEQPVAAVGVLEIGTPIYVTEDGALTTEDEGNMRVGVHAGDAVSASGGYATARVRLRQP